MTLRDVNAPNSIESYQGDQMRKYKRSAVVLLTIIVLMILILDVKTASQGKLIILLYQEAVKQLGNACDFIDDNGKILP